MRILVSNDDGYLAPGIEVLAAALSEIADVNVIAPDRNRSGASHSLTLDRPLRTSRQKNGFISVEGTPTDCVHLAVNGLFDTLPDMVISGINAGANMGDDVLYSGTVAAAIEGRFLGFPAMAVSLVSSSDENYQTAGQVVKALVSRLKEVPLPADTILNVNVPDVPYSELKGMLSTRLGRRHQSESVVEMRDPRGLPCYWVGPPGPEEDAGVGTDFYAVNQGYVSVTPLQIDLTCHDAIEKIGAWLDHN
ncbi:MAG TPA: 5'/3'-nucleotidase SurE [Gammaproteobacteria bacterium]|nr:5'/3'-nucleotidase SurE [Gammaproteobacteria bacterium]